MTKPKRDANDTAGLIRWIGGGEFAGPGDHPPAEFQVFPAGRLKWPGGKDVVVDEAAIAACIREFAARGEDMVIDYEHQSEMGEFQAPDGLAPAAGWIKRLIDKGKDGLWAAVEWTDKAKQFLTAREYRYFSPVFYTEEGTGRLNRLVRVALTNAPRLARLQPLVAKDAGAETAATGGMSPTEGNMGLKEMLIEALGMDPGATDDDIVAKVKGMAAPEAEAEAVAAKETLAQVAKEMGVAPEGPAMIAHVAKLNLTGAGKDELAVRVAKLESERHERETNDLVNAAAADGKITPAMIASARSFAGKDPEGFKVWIAAQPRIVEPSRLHVAKDKPGQSGTRSEESLKLQRDLRLTDEDHKKFGRSSQ